eukprot:2749274-Prymnesium_polylepis.1
MLVPLATTPHIAALPPVRTPSPRAAALLSRRSQLSALLPLVLGASTPLLPSAPALAAPAPEEREVVRGRGGLKYVDFREGSGPTPRYGQLIRFNYI